jgi:hypothetical protein
VLSVVYLFLFILPFEAQLSFCFLSSIKSTILTMHNCLTIQELVRLITEFCVDGELETDRHTLLAIASTCRTFEEPALDRLWYKLESLRPLFKCLPQDAWEEKVVAADPEIGHRAGDTSMVSDSVLFASALNIILSCLLKRT